MLEGLDRLFGIFEVRILGYCKPSGCDNIVEPFDQRLELLQIVSVILFLDSDPSVPLSLS
jgi:hypothetical protein